MIDKYKLYYRTFLVLFWTGMCLGFVCDELPFLSPIRNPLLVVIDIVLMIMGLVLLRQRLDKLVIGSFFIIGVVSTLLVNRLGVMTFFNGSRDFFGLLFTIPVLRFFLTGPRKHIFKANIDKQLKIWLILQAVCITFQFLKYGANDHGGGTMGNGGSGMASMLIYLTSFYLLIQKWDFDNVWASIKENKLYLILLYPSFLNETKVSFVLLLGYILLLYKPTRKSIMKLVYIIPLGIVALIGIATVYINVTHQEADDVFSYDFVYEYLVGQDVDYYVDLAQKLQDGYFDEWMIAPEDFWTVDIQRMSKLILLPDALKRQNGGMLLGAGLGQFKGGTFSDSTPFAREYKWLLQGSRPWPFFVLVQLGWIGLIWFFWMFIRNIFMRIKYDPVIRRMLILIGLAALLIQFYNDSLRYYYFCFALFYLSFAINIRQSQTDSKRGRQVNEGIKAPVT